MTEIEASQRRFMQSCEIQQPPSRRDWLETLVLLAIGAVAGYCIAIIIN
jgi:hypothetical protein